MISSYTRRGAIALLAAGSLLWLIETDAFSAVETNRSANIGAKSDKTALLGIEGVGSQTVFSQPHTITITNRTQKRIKLTVESPSNQFSFSLSQNTMISGESIDISVSTNKSSEVSGTITFIAESIENGTDIEAARQLRFSGTSELPTRCLFTQNQGAKLQTITSGGSSSEVNITTLLTETDVRAIGASRVDFDTDSTSDAVFQRKGSDSISLIDSDDQGNARKLDTGSIIPRVQKTQMTTGSFDGSEKSVFYVSSGEIYALNETTSSSPKKIASPENGAQAVAGIGDIDGDDTDELIFVDGSQTIRYVKPQDDTRTTFASTEVAAGSSNNVGIGAPADFTGDGTASVPIVDGSNRVVLLGPNGVRQVLIGGSTNQAAKSPVAASDIDDDGTVEVVYIRNGGEEELRSVDTDGTVVSLTTSTGEIIPADKKRGVTVVG